jgi:hypothetical protein
MELHDTDFSFRNHEVWYAILRSVDHEGHESIPTWGDVCLAQAAGGMTALAGHRAKRETQRA